MEPIDIKRALEDNGVLQKDIAKKLGVSDTMVSYVIRKIATSRKIQDEVCRVLNKNFNEVWGKK